jgi:hypothetical protein
MERRKFLNFGAGSALTVLLSACGGGGGTESSSEVDAPTDQDETDTSVVVEPALDPATLSSLPKPITIDMAALLEVVDAPLRASVVLGEAAQVGVSVSFYDAAKNLLGSAVTNEDGIAEIQQSARRAVFAEAQTAAGKIHGIHYYNGLESDPEISIDILQTIIANVILEIAGNPNQYNIGSYVLQDYFRVPNDVNLFNIGHHYELLDQRLMDADRRKSNLHTEKYSEKITNDIIKNINDDSHYNLSFNQKYNSTPKSNQFISAQRNEIANEIVKSAKNLIVKSIPIPFVSDLAGYAFGKFVDWIDPNPGSANPFDTIYASLAAIENKINSLANRTEEIALTQAISNMMMNFSAFSNLTTELDRLNEKNNADRLNLYKKALIDLGSDTTGGPRDKTLIAHRMFVGCGEFERSAVIDQLTEVIKKKKFYSRISENKYKNYLEFYIAKQAMAHIFLGASYIVRAKEHNETTSSVQAKLERLSDDFEKIIQSIEELTVPTLPDRINIDHENKLAWVGICQSLYELKDLWPSDREVIYKKPSGRINCSGGTCRVEEFTYSRVQGAGMVDWSGINVKANLQGSRSYVNTLSQETLEFGNWRTPTLSEVKKSFYDESSRLKLKVDVFASASGFSSFTNTSYYELKSFNNPVTGGLACVPVDFRQAGGTFFVREKYLDLTSVNFENMEIIKSVKATSAYDWGQKRNVYAFLPTMTTESHILVKYLPWLHVATVRANSKNLICK